MSKEWYVELEGKQEGPFSTDKVNAFVKEGKLKVDNLIWCDGMSDWQPVKIIPEFKSLLYESKMDEFAPVDEKAVSPQPVMRQKSQVSPVSYTAKKVVADEGVATAKKGGSVMAVAGLVLIVLSIVVIGGVTLWFRKELTETKATLNSYKTELDDSRKTINSQETEVESAKAEAKKANSRLDSAGEKFGDFALDVDNVKKKLDKANSRLDKASELFRDFKSQLAELKSSVDSHGSETAGSNETIDDIKTKLEKLEDKINDTAGDCKAIKTETRNLNDRIDNTEKRVDGFKERLDSYKSTTKEQSSDSQPKVEKADADIEQGLSAQQYFDKAEEFWQKQDWANAIRYYSKAIEKRSDWAIAYSNRGMAKYNNGDYKSAMYDFDTARKLDPGRKKECGNMIDKCKQKLSEK